MQYMDPSTSRIAHRPRVFIQAIIDRLCESGHSVMSSHIREKWGLNLIPPGDALGEDYGWLVRCDVLVALIEKPPSPGVQFELGVALALGKPIIQLHKVGTALPYLNRGLPLVSAAAAIEYSSLEDCLEQLGQSLAYLALNSVRSTW